MYNLLVRWPGAGQWDETSYEIELDRAVREHTTDALEERFHSFNAAATRALRSFPCLFLYEGNDQDIARIGWITRIRTLTNKVAIDYKFEPSLPPIPADKIWNLSATLDINKFEKTRTHWAVKEVELFPALIAAGLIGPGAISLQAPDHLAMNLGPQTGNMVVRPIVFKLPTMPPQMDLVSAMMPFGTQFDAVYSSIQMACTSLNLQCLRADDIWEHSEIIQDVFSLIFRSKIIVCDFSNRNPNVFYETGVAHTLGRSVVPIAQNVSDVPFDLQHHRAIHYLNNSEGLRVLQSKLIGRLRTLIGE